MLVKGQWQEGQGPKRRQGRGGGHRNHTNQALDTVNDALADIAYMATSHTFSHYDWILDSATTSHICSSRDAFINYSALDDAPIQGLGSTPAQAKGQGTVIVNFSVKENNIQHQLHNVLHVPEAPNSLISVSRIDDGGGHITFRDSGCQLYSKTGQLIGEGIKVGRLYCLDARAQLQTNECTNLAAPKKLSWDHWTAVMVILECLDWRYCKRKH